MNIYKQKLKPSSGLPADHVGSGREESNKQNWKSPWSKQKTMSQCLKEEREKLFGERKSKKSAAQKECKICVSEVIIDGVPVDTESKEI